jgi:hypothetical protein
MIPTCPVAKSVVSFPQKITSNFLALFSSIFLIALFKA